MKTLYPNGYFFMRKPCNPRAVLQLCVMVCLAACTPMQRPEVPAAVWQAQRAQLNALQAWELSAALAVNTADDGFDARLHWRQQAGGAYHLRLHGPLGQGTVLVDGNAAGVVLRTGDGEERRAADPEALLHQVAGVEVPLGYLTYWIRGLPVPSLQTDSEYFAADGSLSLLEQAGWRIEYTRHTESKGRYLPTKLYLKNADYRAKFVISRWSVD